MKTHTMKCALIALLVPLAWSPAWSAETPKLVAPLYSGAVPVFPAGGIKNPPRFPAAFGKLQALDCQGTEPSRDFAGKTLSAQQAAASGEERRWCFLTRDPIDKVKAFYEKSVGPMQGYRGSLERIPAEGYVAYTERAVTKMGMESGPAYRGVSLHALRPPVKGRSTAKNSEDTWQGQDDFQFYSGSRHFNGFLQGTAFMGGPGRPPAELDALYKKHGKLEGALFQRNGAKSEPIDVTLRARTGKKQQELQKAANQSLTGAFTMTPAQMQQMQQQAQQPMPGNQSASPEDAEFNAFMKKNPKVAKRFMELTQKALSLAQQGKFDEADAVDEELEKLVQSHPELAAIEARADERSAAAGAPQQGKESQAMAAMGKQQDQANWGVWVEYLKAVEKEAYYTLIVIDEAFRGSEQGYSKDRKQVAQQAAGLVPHQVLELRYDGSAQAASHSPAAAQPAAAQPEQPKQPEDEIKDAAKKGWKALKKLF